MIRKTLQNNYLEILSQENIGAGAIRHSLVVEIAEPWVRFPTHTAKMSGQRDGQTQCELVVC